MDIIEIKNLEIFANHGVFPEENVLGQKFVVSAKLYTSTRKAGLTDDLTASIHYGEVSQMITKFTKEHTYKLLETLAENLCQMLLHEFPLMNAITPGVLFNFPSRYFFTIGYQLVFSLTGWSPLLHTRFHVSRTTLDSTLSTCFSYTGLSPSLVCFPKQFY